MPRAGRLPATLPALLDRLLREDGARPLLTFYDLDTGERVELSVASTENWVAKTANLLQDSLGVSAGARIHIDLPVHWQAVVWTLACWQSGCILVTGPGASPDVAVVRHCAAAVADGDEVVALALAPMGARSVEPVPPGVLDYDAEVLGHGDRFVASDPPGPDSAAVEVNGTVMSHRALLTAVGTGAQPARPRLLLTASPFGTESLPSWLAAIAAGGSLVLVTGADDPEHTRALDALVASEQVTARA